MVFSREIGPVRALQAHLSTGAVLLAVVLVRLGLRFGTKRALAPPVGTGLPRLASITHFALYCCLLLLPVLGYLRLAALGFEIRFLGLLSLPPMTLDPPLALAAAEAHGAVALLLGALIALHVAGAVLHRRLFGTDVLDRMTVRLQRGTAAAGRDDDAAAAPPYAGQAAIRHRAME